MEFKELVKTRQSDRSYENRAVEREKIEAVLEAARLAPSANNSQSWTFVVVDEPELKNSVAKNTAAFGANFNQFAAQAPVIIAVVAEKPILMLRIGNFIQQKDYTQIDIGIAVENLVLQASDLGLGTCILGWFKEKAIKKTLNIPKSKRLLLLVTLGYSTDKQRKKRRKAFDETVKWNKY
ncbi:MAG: nitroreductase family protein [Prevotellaceae bacterium]|jgi:nitroreductase|nr:nitroreductase family protein [Prevotellaceae bacterium]